MSQTSLCHIGFPVPDALFTRDWVISHARQHILSAFQRLTGARKQAHSQYLASLPYYSVYMEYSGHPPIHPIHLAQLQAQITEAHAELKRGIDADWRASVLRYPEVLDYFYSLVYIKVPPEDSTRVLQPPFAVAGYKDAGYDHSRIKVKKKKRRSDRESSAAPDERSRGGRRGEDHMFTVAHRLRGPPPVPTPPIQPGYPPPPPPQPQMPGYYPY